MRRVPGYRRLRQRNTRREHIAIRTSGRDYGIGGILEKDPFRATLLAYFFFLSIAANISFLPSAFFRRKH